jgi:hypothetical protein
MAKATVGKLGSSVRVSRTTTDQEGDAVYMTKTHDGFKVTPYDPDFEGTMKVAEGVMVRYRNVLRELAK